MKSFLLLTFICLTTGNLLAFDWEQRADFGGSARHRTTMLAIGNKVYLGLGHYNGAGPNILFDDWWEYDPATNAWTQKANYLGGLMYHASGFAIDGIGYVGTGRNISAAVVNTFFSYDPTTNTWEQKANFPGAGRRGGVGFAIDGYGYIGTGSYYSDFYKYDPSTDTWTTVAALPTSGRISAVGFALNGYGYVGTGSTAGAQKDFWRYDPALDQWQQMADVGTIPRQEASGFAVMGKGYILTGDNYSSGDNYGDMWEYNPVTDTWTQMEDFPGTARRYLSCTTLGNVAYAGLGTNGTNFKDFWVYDPVASLIENNLDKIHVTPYPNPATDVLNFRIDGLDNIPLEDLRIEITDLYGRVVLTEALSSGMTNISTGHLAAGNYLYSLVYKKEMLRTGKIMLR